MSDFSSACADAAILGFDELGNPLREPAEDTFARWDDDGVERRVVARTAIAPGLCVSTLCLGAEHFGDVAPEGDEPRVYETLIIGGTYDGHLWPHATCARAQLDHAAAVHLALAGTRR